MAKLVTLIIVLGVVYTS